MLYSLEIIPCFELILIFAFLRSFRYFYRRKGFLEILPYNRATMPEYR